MTFKKYMHLERLGTSEVEGIQSGEVFVFPKLDGTNASVWFEDGNLKAGSRNRELSIHNDNAGFYNWVLSDKVKEKFLNYFKNNKDHILYGEWLVPHSLKTYQDDAWRKFYIFDVWYNDRLLSYSEYVEDLKQHDLDFLSPIVKLRNPTDEMLIETLKKNIHYIKDGEGIGEGVVVKNYYFTNNFGRVVWAKIIANHFKEKHHSVMGPPECGSISEEEKIVMHFVTEHLVNKVYDKIVLEVGSWNSKLIPRLINTVFYDLIREEMWEIIKKHNNPKIDFKFLSRLTTQRIKQLKGELF